MKNVFVVFTFLAWTGLGCAQTGAPRLEKRGIRRPHSSSVSTSPQLYLTTTVAGIPDSSGYTGDGGAANAAQLANPIAIAIDSKGNYYISDFHNNVIREVYASNGTIATIAGTGTPGFSGDGGPASSAQFSAAYGLAVDGAGNLYIADAPNARIRKIDAATGNISTFAGNGSYGDAGDGGPAADATLYWPAGVTVDPAGNVYIADFGSSTVRKVSAATGIITTVAGIDVTGNGEFPGLGGPAVNAILGRPYAAAADESGNLYVLDVGMGSILKIGKNGIINTFVSNVSAASLTTDPAGNLYYADARNSVINKVSSDGTVTAIAGISGTSFFAGDGGPASLANFNAPYSVALDSSGNIYIADYNNDVIRELTPLAAPNVIVANGASNVGYSSPGVQLPIAPGEVVTIFGTNIGNPTESYAEPNANGVYPTQFASTTVTFNGIAAPILVSGPNQVTAVAPYEISGAAQANLVVMFQGLSTVTASLPVAASSPGIFTADFLNGLSVLNDDGTVNSPSNPAADSSTITLFVTGEGLTTPAGTDGLVNAASNTPVPVLPVSATVGGTAAVVALAVEAPGQVAGILQVNVTLPSAITGQSASPLQVTIGTAVSNTIPVAVQ